MKSSPPGLPPGLPGFPAARATRDVTSFCGRPTKSEPRNHNSNHNNHNNHNNDNINDINNNDNGTNPISAGAHGGSGETGGLRQMAGRGGMRAARGARDVFRRARDVVLSLVRYLRVMLSVVLQDTAQNHHHIEIGAYATFLKQWSTWSTHESHCQHE